MVQCVRHSILPRLK
ncbi:pyrBI operon leader peptide, partial [Salmonella enterica subsp. enterica serovar Anatum]